MARRRSYKAQPVNQLVPDRIVSDAIGLAASGVSVGIDVSKHDLFVVDRIGEEQFSRPVKVLQPSEIGTLVSRLSSIHERVPIQIGLESTGTYGDAIRCALHKAGFDVTTSAPLSQRWQDTAALNRTFQAQGSSHPRIDHLTTTQQARSAKRHQPSHFHSTNNTGMKFRPQKRTTPGAQSTAVNTSQNTLDILRTRPQRKNHVVRRKRQGVLHHSDRSRIHSWSVD